MPFLKDFIINPSTKIKLWKLNLGELDYFELDDYGTEYDEGDTYIGENEQKERIRKPHNQPT